MVKIDMPKPEDLPPVDWSKTEKEAAEEVRKLTEFTERAHKRASKSKIIYQIGK